MEGHHAVKRNSVFWAGIWTDLLIEQTLMRPVKTRGGLTSGRTMSKFVRNIWIASIKSSAKVLDAIMELTRSLFQGSEQHKELGVSRPKLDNEHCLKFYNWLKKGTHFISNPHTCTLYQQNWFPYRTNTLSTAIWPKRLAIPYKNLSIINK